VGGQKVIEIPAEPATEDQLPPLLKGFTAVPPLVTDIDLSMDDKYLSVACWGTGDLQQYDVSDPFSPKLAGKVRIGGIVSRPPIPVRTVPGSVVDRSWWRSAVMASAPILPLALRRDRSAVLPRGHRRLDGEARRHRHRHRRRVGMQTELAGILLWSFLVATAHGAGPMLWPILTPVCFPSG
jgi:56kDa selenium binding protein (SBP56)